MPLSLQAGLYNSPYMQAYQQQQTEGTSQGINQALLQQYNNVLL